jgi:phage gp29-like protein
MFTDNVEKFFQDAAMTNGAADVESATQDEVTLTSFITSQESRGLSSRIMGRPATIQPGDRGASAALSAMRGALWQYYMQGNPGQFLQQVRPTQSNAAAMGFIYTNSLSMYDLLDEMTAKDTTIGSTIRLISGMVMAFEESISATDADDGEAVEFAKVLTDQIMGTDSTFGWGEMRRSAIQGAISHGFSKTEMIYSKESDLWLPTIFIHRHPGQFVFDEMGNSYLDLGSQTFEPVAPNKFVSIRIPAIYGNPYGKSMIFDLRWLYWFKKESMKAWVDYCDVTGIPIGIGKVEAGADEIEILMENLRSILAGLHRDTGIVLRPDQSIEWKDRAAGRGGETPHQMFVEWADRQIVRYMLGAVLQVMESEYGSRAQASQHKTVQDVMLVHLARLLEEAINRDVVKAAVVLNKGESWRNRIRYRIDTDELKDVQSVSEIFKTASQVGVETSKAQFRDWLGLNAPENEDDVVAPNSALQAFSEKKKTMTPRWRSPT